VARGCEVSADREERRSGREPGDSSREANGQGQRAGDCGKGQEHNRDELHA